EGHAIAALGGALAELAHLPQQSHARAHRARGHIGGRCRAPLTGGVLVALERVAGEIEAEHLLLVAQELLGGPLGDARQRALRLDGRRRRAGRVEERGLSLLAIALAPLPRPPGVIGPP